MFSSRNVPAQGSANFCKRLTVITVLKTLWAKGQTLKIFWSFVDNKGGDK